MLLWRGGDEKHGKGVCGVSLCEYKLFRGDGAMLFIVRIIKTRTKSAYQIQ
jgi:hypothetical protein